jgi:WXXGXW repeat (2 copies)
MRLFRSMRLLFLALALCAVPASSFAGVLISVGFAPPVLPVYEQPPCPQAGWMWTPGYWAYGPDGYYWVPGAWVPAPYVGALWTPGYWGWETGFYVWHPGYWGRHVGYYGGIDYGFGYMGVGFVGGMWRGNAFAYNTAVVRVNNVYIHNTYVDRAIVERNTIRNERRVSFNGGRGGIEHAPTAEERAAMHEQHLGRTSFQTQHVEAARNDHAAYFNANHGHPSNLAVARPMGHPNTLHEAPRNNFNSHPQQFSQPHGNPSPNYSPRPTAPPHVQPHAAPQYQPHGNPQSYDSHPQGHPDAHPAPHEKPHEEHPESHPRGKR